MFKYRTDVQPNREYSITIDTDNKKVFNFFQELARACIDGKQVSVTVTEKVDFETINMGVVIE